MKINIEQREQIIRGPQGIELHLDADEIFPHDPGQGTPVLVVLSTGDSATFNCVDSELEVDGIKLTDQQQTWIRSIGDDVDAWLTAWTAKA